MENPSSPSPEASQGGSLRGRFSEATDEFVQVFTASIDFDRRLYREDIAGSIAHATMLETIGVLTLAEQEQIVSGLNTILREIEDGEMQWRVELEDVHMNIEHRLIELVGDTGKKLHTGRSRNDQVATDIRLYLRTAIDHLVAQQSDLLRALADLADANADTIMPGFTHLQAAQPITLGHHLMAWFEMLKRDRDRLLDCRKRVNHLPLGAAALAGTPYLPDRNLVAQLLDFDGVCENSLDAVSDRDFAIEFCAAAALCLTHMSRWCEEMVLWSSQQFDFITLPDRFCTGSSIMPQKKNPDAAELIRAKVGRIFGANVALMMVMKGLPLAYSKDMQEDKEQVFDAADNLMLALAAMEGMVKDMSANRESLAAAAGSGFSTATDLADWLVRVLGLPFRDAHHITGSLVALAEQNGCDLPDLTLEQMQSAHGDITADVFDVLGVENSVNSRMSYGGTAPAQVRAQVARWKGIIG